MVDFVSLFLPGGDGVDGGFLADEAEENLRDVFLFGDVDGDVGEEGGLEEFMVLDAVFVVGFGGGEFGGWGGGVEAVVFVEVDEGDHLASDSLEGFRQYGGL